MKKLLAILLTSMLLVAMFAIPASADAQAFGGVFNPDESVDGDKAVIYKTEDTAGAWWARVAFKPVSGDIWEVVAMNNPDGTNNGTTALAVPSNGFVFAIHYSCTIENLRTVITSLKAGDLVTITGLDLANETIAADATIVPPGPTVELDVANNIAKGKSYTSSKTYRQGGADVNWAYDENAAEAYPDTNGVELTDGIVANNDAYTNEAWVGLHDGTPDASDAGYSWVTVDLGEVSEITGIQAYIPTAWVGKSANVNVGDPAATVTFWGSNDGETFTEIGTATVSDINVDNEPNAIASYTGDAEARYVQVRMTRGGWTFISEVVVLGAEEDSNTSTPSTSTPSTSTPSTSTPSTSTPSTGTPNTGDASSVVMFAVIALVAIAGSAVVIRKRG